MKTYPAIVFFIFLCCFVVYPGNAITLQNVFVQVHGQGDADLIISYQLDPIEYAGIFTKKTNPEVAIEAYLAQYLGKEVDILCSDMGVMKLNIKNYAQVNGAKYTTPEINLAALILSIGSDPQLTYSLFPDVVTVFPDGYSIQESRTSTIHETAYTFSGMSFQPPYQPFIQCRQENTLPLSNIIPDSLAPVAAVVSGAVMGSVGLLSGATGFASWISRLFGFLRGMTGTESTEILQDRMKMKRGVIHTGSGDRTIFGFSPTELAVVILGALVFGLAFFFAGRNPIQWEMVLIFIFVGGVTTIIHEIAHWLVANRYQTNSELQFWGLGTIIMFLTAWLFGDVFAQPTLTVMQSDTSLDNRASGLVMIAGPLTSLCFAFVCLALISLGGVIATAGTIGFSMNLLTCVYSLLPIKPLDGEGVYKWNKVLWAVFFIPVLVTYVAVNLM
jgi:Zn-dependent protease